MAGGGGSASSGSVFGMGDAIKIQQQMVQQAIDFANQSKDREDAGWKTVSQKPRPKILDRAEVPPGEKTADIAKGLPGVSNIIAGGEQTTPIKNAPKTIAVSNQKQLLKNPDIQAPSNMPVLDKLSYAKAKRQTVVEGTKRHGRTSTILSRKQ